MTDVSLRGSAVALIQPRVTADQDTILGDGTPARPLHAGRGGGGASLPLSIHGSLFQADQPGVVNPQLSAAGLTIPGQARLVVVMAPVILPAGTRVARIVVRVIDNVSTPLEARFNADDGSMLRISQPSPGDGRPHDLLLDVGAVLVLGRGYFVEVISPSGKLSWTVRGADVS